MKERQGECDNCGFETTVFEIKTGAIEVETHNYCGVCSGTFLSKATSYPEQVPDPALYKSIGYIANWILDEISKIKVGKA